MNLAGRKSYKDSAKKEQLAWTEVAEELREGA